MAPSSVRRPKFPASTWSSSSDLVCGRPLAICRAACATTTATTAWLRLRGGSNKRSAEAVFLYGEQDWYILRHNFCLYKRQNYLCRAFVLCTSKSWYTLFHYVSRHDALQTSIFFFNYYIIFQQKHSLMMALSSSCTDKNKS